MENKDVKTCELGRAMASIGALFSFLAILVVFANVCVGGNGQLHLPFIALGSCLLVRYLLEDKGDNASV